MTIELLDTPKRSNLTAARAIAKLLLPTEEVIDRSIVASSQLLQQLAQARIDTGLSASTGHEAMRAASEGISALLEARDMIVQCHRNLVDVRDALGVQGRDAGCTYNSPDSKREVRDAHLHQAA